MVHPPKKIILGSQSPRRKEILGYFSLPFIQLSPSFDETSIEFQKDPLEYVLALSREKALSLEKGHEDDIIITADTVVFKEGKIFEKPHDKNDAYHSLLQLAGKWHSVFTGMTILHQNKIIQGFDETKVLMNALDEREIAAYLENNQWKDKAGGYAIQKSGGLLIKRIDGCYYNVMGLSINILRKLLLEVKIDLWNFIGDTLI